MPYRTADPSAREPTPAQGASENDVVLALQGTPPAPRRLMADELELDAPIEEPEVPALAPIYAPSPTAEEAIRAFANGPRTELRLIELEGPRGEGKGEPNQSLTLTPSGWVKIGDLAAGDDHHALMDGAP